MRTECIGPLAIAKVPKVTPKGHAFISKGEFQGMVRSQSTIAVGRGPSDPENQRPGDEAVLSRPTDDHHSSIGPSTPRLQQVPGQLGSGTWLN